MSKRRQPSKQFLRRLKGNGKPVAQVPEKRPSRIRKFYDSDGWLYAEVCVAVAGLIGLLFLIPTGYALWVDLEDRQTQRIAQAWETVTRPVPGNSGKGPALEYLNSQGIPLVGIDLSKESNQGQSYLQEVDLSGAALAEANLSGADLRDANLSGAKLWRGDLSGARLWRADLSGAELKSANLSKADLFGTDLTDANLSDANLSGTDLMGAKNITQERLDAACGDENTKLSERFTIKVCLEE